MAFLSRDTFAVWGLARSGVAAANLLARLGKRVIASDTASEEELSDALERLEPNVEVITGKNVWQGAEVIVLSPGLKPSLPIFDAVPDSIPLVSEIEIAREASRHCWVAITGTDGKTTTTELTAHLLQGCDQFAVAAGNIGTPLCEAVETLPADGVVVAEVSAFQLWSTHRFAADADAITNLAADHLDYFDGDFDAYVDAKRRLFVNARPEQAGVFNADDPIVATWIDDFPGRTFSFGTRSCPGVDVAYAFDGDAILRNDETLLRWADAPLVGRHNAFNAMAALGLCEALGGDPATLVESLLTFEPLPHRIEPVGEQDGVRWVNDSKATNVHAALAGLEALEGDLVVIAGGVDKGLELGEFATYLTGRGAEVVLIGQIAERLEQELLTAGLGADAIHRAETLADAVEQAKKYATPGATVVLSPACSSFDMFASYVDRGNQFRALVESF